MLGPKDGEVCGQELPTTLSVLVQFLLQESLLVWVGGPKLSVKGTSPAAMDACRTRKQTSLSSPTWILLCSFWVALINFKQISGSCLHGGLWFLRPDWITILSSSLMATQSLFGEDLGLNYGLSIILPRPVRIRSVLKKEAACGVRAGGLQVSVGEWKTSLWKGPRDRGGGFNWKASWEEEKIPEVQRRKDGNKWDIGELGLRVRRDREPGLTSKTPHE